MKRSLDGAPLVEAADPDDAAAVSAGLAFQLEDLIATVWRAEENWRFDDRLDLACREEP